RRVISHFGVGLLGLSLVAGHSPQLVCVVHLCFVVLCFVFGTSLELGGGGTWNVSARNSVPYALGGVVLGTSPHAVARPARYPPHCTLPTAHRTHPCRLLPAACCLLNLSPFPTPAVRSQ